MEDTKLAKVLVVDDEPNIVELLTVSLKFQNFEVLAPIPATRRCALPAR